VTVAALDTGTRERYGVAEDAEGLVVTAVDEDGPAAGGGDHLSGVHAERRAFRGFVLVFHDREASSHA